MPYPYTDDYEEKKYQAPKLQTDRSIWKFILFNILTLGIYSIIFFMPFSLDLDKIMPKRDGTKTMSYLLACILALFTFSFVIHIWHYQIAQRIEEALEKRNISYEFGMDTFWGWYFFGSLILVGPFIYFYKLCRAMNLLCADYNERPEI